MAYMICVLLVTEMGKLVLFRARMNRSVTVLVEPTTFSMYNELTPDTTSAYRRPPGYCRIHTHTRIQ